MLPLSRRQVVSPDGVLTITDVDRQADADTYTCTARNKQGHSDQKTVQVHVVGMRHSLLQFSEYELDRLTSQWTLIGDLKF